MYLVIYLLFMESKIKINNIRLLNSWCYNLKNNTDCTICRCNLNCNSFYAQEKGTESNVVFGICGHTFHYECIDPWIKSNPHCPICSSKWTYAK
jgi:hypothetical protein